MTETLSYSGTLDALVGWIGFPVRVTAHDSRANPLLVLNGELGRAPDSAELGEDEARYFCVGHDHPNETADGFYLPSATFRHGMYTDTPLGVDPRSALFVAFEGSSLLIEQVADEP
jgi:hypothetical protein